MRINAESVKHHAQGQWLSIISSLASQLSGACQNPGQHVICPCHGQADGFRLFADAKETGGGYCNLTGAKVDGFAVLMWANGWTFPQALDAVANYVGLTDGSLSIIRKHTPRSQPKKDWAREIKQLEQIWNEAQSGAGNTLSIVDWKLIHLQHSGFIHHLNTGTTRSHTGAIPVWWQESSVMVYWLDFIELTSIPMDRVKLIYLLLKRQ